MKTAYRRSTHPLIPPYDENGALQLIIASGVTFILFHFSRIVWLIIGTDKHIVARAMFPNFGLFNKETFQDKPWTILTYGWLHHGFFDWFTNMIWLYCFASVLQSLAGHRQVIPLFFYALLVGGACFLGSQYLPGTSFQPPAIFMGAQAGVMALGFAALTLAPRYRLYLTPTFSIPLVLIVAVYVVLDLVAYIPDQSNVLILCLGGVVTGFVYSRLLKSGFAPGTWIYDMIDRAQRVATPNEARLAEKKSIKRVEILRTMYEPKKGISQDRIDEILDKINDHGYHSLSREEKDILFRASKD